MDRIFIERKCIRNFYTFIISLSQKKLVKGIILSDGWCIWNLKWVYQKVIWKTNGRSQSTQSMLTNYQAPTTPKALECKRKGGHWKHQKLTGFSNFFSHIPSWHEKGDSRPQWLSGILQSKVNVQFYLQMLWKKSDENSLGATIVHGTFR